MKTKKIGSARSARTTALMRIGGLGLIVAVFVGPIAAQADGNGGSDVFGGMTSSFTGMFGFGGDSNAATPEGFGADGSWNPTDGMEGGVDAGGGRAIAKYDGGDPLTSIGNSGLGSGNQVNLTTQVPVNVQCNGVGILGNADADCPVAPVGNGDHQGGGHKGGGYPGHGGHGGGYGPTPPPTPTPTVTPTHTPTSPTPSVAGTTVASLPLTGSPSATIGYMGGGLLVLGGGLLFLARNRRKVAAASAMLGANRSARKH